MKESTAYFLLKLFPFPEFVVCKQVYSLGTVKFLLTKDYHYIYTCITFGDDCYLCKCLKVFTSLYCSTFSTKSSRW